MTNLDFSRPDPSPGIRKALESDYPHVLPILEDFRAKVADLPPKINDQSDHDKYVDTITEIRARFKDVEAYRVAEKDPHLKAERAVDGFFVPIRDGLEKLMQACNAAVTVYDRRIAAEERARREAEEAEARRLEAEARRREQEALQRAEEAKRADYRAKHTAAAEKAAVEARAAEETAFVASQRVNVKPAELARSRSEKGTLSTLRSSWVFEVENWDAINLDQLKPYIMRVALETAIKAAVANGVRSLNGVRIFQTEKAVVR